MARDAAGGWGATPGSGPRLDGEPADVSPPAGCCWRFLLGDDLVLDLRKLYSVTPTLGGDPFQRNDGELIVRHSFLAGVVRFDQRRSQR